MASFTETRDSGNSDDTTSFTDFIAARQQQQQQRRLLKHPKGDQQQEQPKQPKQPKQQRQPKQAAEFEQQRQQRRQEQQEEQEAMLADLYKTFCQSKSIEWSSKGVYPTAAKIAKLKSSPAFRQTEGRCYHSFGCQTVLHLQLAETLRLLGWPEVDPADFRTVDRLTLTTDNLLLAGPEAAAVLRQRADYSRFACSLAYWEHHLHCLDSYWLLHDTLQSFEQSLQVFVRMGLLGKPGADNRRISSGDFMLPTLHLGEVWGSRLASFLKAHDSYSFRLGRAVASDAQPQEPQDLLVYQPARADKSGRKRLDRLERMCEDLRRPETGMAGLVLRAWPDGELVAMGRRFTLETFLLLAPRRNPVEHGFAAFFHRGFVRVSAADQNQKALQPSSISWTPEQLSDYMAAAEPKLAKWLQATAYPQAEAAAAYLATALAQHVLDSSYQRYHLLRLSYMLEGGGNLPNDKQHRVRLVDVNQRPSGTPDALDDPCECLVLPRVAQEAALILAELLTLSEPVSGTPGLAARSLVSPHNMKLVYDSEDPAVQSSLLSSQHFL